MEKNEEREKHVSFYQAARAYRKALNDVFPLKAVLLERLRDLAEQSGQNVIAKAIGVSAQYLNDIIHGRRDVSMSFLEKVNGRYIIP
jgi:transcriptional regulator with XRE-family HTH domain